MCFKNRTKSRIEIPKYSTCFSFVPFHSKTIYRTFVCWRKWRKCFIFRKEKLHSFRNVRIELFVEFLKIESFIFLRRIFQNSFYFLRFFMKTSKTQNKKELKNNKFGALYQCPERKLLRLVVTATAKNDKYDDYPE